MTGRRSPRDSQPKMELCTKAPPDRYALLAIIPYRTAAFQDLQMLCIRHYDGSILAVRPSILGGGAATA